MVDVLLSDVRADPEDVIAALRLAELATGDYKRFAEVALVLLRHAPDTPDDNRGGVELVLRLQREGHFKFEVSD